MMRMKKQTRKGYLTRNIFRWGKSSKSSCLLFWFFDQCVHITRIVDDVLGHAERGRRRERGEEGEGTYISVPDLKEVLGTRVTCLEKSRYGRETNGNKSKLLRASLQACFACNCSNLRKHSLFLFLFLCPFSFAFSLHFANLIIMMIIIGTIRGPCMFFPSILFSLLTQPTHVWFVCLFNYTFVA